jgi:hypothetical protein
VAQIVIDMVGADWDGVEACCSPGALIVARCPDGVLADRDRLWVEVTAALFSQFRNDPAGMHPAKLLRLTAMLAGPGMSPANASRVVAKPAKTPNDFADD